MKIKVISLVISIISLLIWWEFPIAVIILAAINVVIICKNYDGGIFFRVNIALYLIGVCLACLNWDLHIGLKLLDRYNGR